MKVTSLTPRAFEFACHSKACAPPPAGRGGSDKGGNVSAVGNLMARNSAIGKGPPAGWGNDPTRSGPKSKGWGTGGSVGKQGVMKMTQQAAHRAEAARQIDSRNRAVARSKGATAGHPVTGPKQSLYSPVTGRLRPSPVRAAFKQGMGEIIGKTPGAKRTTLKNGGVRTVKTYNGREISHLSSKGGVARKSKPAYMNSQLAKNVEAYMNAAYANMRSYSR